MSPGDGVPHTEKSPRHSRMIIHCIWQTSGALRAATNLPNTHCEPEIQMERVKYALKKKVNCKGVLFLHMRHGFPRMAERRCAIDIPPRILRQLITTSSFPWTTTFVGNTSQLRQIWGKHSLIYLRPRYLRFTARYRADWGTLENVSGYRWGAIKVFQISYLSFLYNN